MKKEDKAKVAESIRQELAKAKAVILSSFEGLTVAQDSELRRKMMEAGAKYRVAKNSLVERAARGTAAEAVASRLVGTTSLALTEADPVKLAKALTAYAKENPALVFKAGIVEGRVVSLADLMALASLPSRESLFAQALALINAPATRVASTVRAVARNLVVVIQEGVKQKKFTHEET